MFEFIGLIVLFLAVSAWSTHWLTQREERRKRMYQNLTTFQQGIERIMTQEQPH